MTVLTFCYRDILFRNALIVFHGDIGDPKLSVAQKAVKRSAAYESG